MSMANMSPTKLPMPEQNPSVRNHNFQEVALGYTPRWPWRRPAAASSAGSPCASPAAR